MDNFYTESIVICLIATQPDFMHCEMEVFKFAMFILVFNCKFDVRRLEPKDFLRIKLFFLSTILIKIVRIRLLTDREWVKRPPVANISHTYPAILKLETFIFYLEKTKKKYSSHDSLLEVC